MQLDFGINAGFVEELYAQYLENRETVDPTWQAYFDERTGLKPMRGAPGTLANGELARYLGATPAAAAPLAPRDDRKYEYAATQARVAQLVNAYRVRGHLFAHINPLGVAPSVPPELELSHFDLSPEHLDKKFSTTNLHGPDVRTLREIIRNLEETYCRSIGVEYMLIEDPVQRTWLQERMESTRNRLALGRQEQLRILTLLSDAEIFEQFIHRSYAAGTKRFSLEGAESLIPLLDLLIERAGSSDVEEIVIGMAHRGRLNVLANIMDKSVREIFAAFEDKDAETHRGSGDVKYHLGYSSDRLTPAGTSIHLTLSFNPSHLEFVNPVVEGRARAKQDRSARGPSRVMPLLIHGDAAFIGQGIAAETLNLTGLRGYATGGTLHVIVNNQVGFTTNPSASRSTRYASDITRMLKCPVFHVNGEDPEAVAQVTQLAIDFRQRFGADVVIDMYCYRRYGHNEGDEPRYTQPLMYKAIDQKPTVREVYVRRLVGMGQVTEEKAEEIVLRRRKVLAAALDEVKERGFAPVSYSMGGVWTPYRGGPDSTTPEVDTAVPANRLRELSEQLLQLPEDFHAHPKILAILKARHGTS